MRIELTEEQVKQLEPLFQKADDAYAEQFVDPIDKRGILFAQIQSYPKGMMDVVFVKHPLSRTMIDLRKQNPDLIVKE